MDPTALQHLQALATHHALDLRGAKVRRTSSRLCLGVEHGDYNGTNLFGVGTDRYIWVAFKPNGTDVIRLASGNFPEDGLVTFTSGTQPAPPLTEAQSKSWARFPHGVDFVLRTEGLLQRSVGFDCVIWGDIPGGGMSRSASLCLNLIATFLEVNQASIPPPAPGALAREVTLAVQVENEYVGSPCGNLDQIMIWHARENAGTLYEPETKRLSWVPLGAGAPDFSFVALDTGTDRPGLEKSTYKVRREECDAFAAELCAKGFIPRPVLADVKEYGKVLETYAQTSWAPHLRRLEYLVSAQANFADMIQAWRRGDIATVGALFRADGHGLRDDYCISGPELETMCDIARTVEGVWGERMLGGGDKGATGAIVAAGSVEALKAAVSLRYPQQHPDYKFAVHEVRVTTGVATFEGVL